MSDVRLKDVSPSRQQFLDDVLAGLQAERKWLPCKYLYDEQGSQLFERICELDEYYLTRTELAIMRTYAVDISQRLGRRCVVVEYGSGSSKKTRTLLDQLDEPAAYVPVDISREHLKQTAKRLSKKYPGLVVRPVCADFTEHFALPRIEPPGERTVVYFPGSTIGNFGPAEAKKLLECISAVVAHGGGLLIGVDLEKPRAILEAAYDDSQGVTRRFNLNLLARINRELGGDFQLDQFRHQARYNTREERMEMHLISTVDQTVRVDDVAVDFEQGESVHTENSYKYRPERFREIAESAGFAVEKVWTDRDGLFSVQYLTAR